MKTETIYYILIAFIVFTLIKNILAHAIEYKYPTYRELASAPTIWKQLIKIRGLFNMISILFIVVVLYSYKFTSVVKLAFIIMLFHYIMYFIIDKRFIYLIIPETTENINLVKLYDKYGDRVGDIIILMIVIYSLFFIFMSK
jgi:hypothetical protein